MRFGQVRNVRNVRWLGANDKEKAQIGHYSCSVDVTNGQIQVSGHCLSSSRLIKELIHEGNVVG